MNPICPSILSTNFFNLNNKLNEFEQCKVDILHLDVMDGHFVDNISFGPSMAASIKSKFKFLLDSHLMVSNPQKFIGKFIKAGSDWISIHVETEEDVEKNINLIKSHSKKAGLVLNPDTDLEEAIPFLGLVDYILLMSVFPGYGGQKFILDTINRVYKLREKIKGEGVDCIIQVDGGINNENIVPLKEAGADLFVVGTFLFNSTNIPGTHKAMLDKLYGVNS